MTAPVTADITIVGGGMVGAALASALAPLGLRVLIVEASTWGSIETPGYDDRSTAISLGSQQILAAIGAWESLTGAATPIHQVHVSDRGRFGAARIQREQQGVPALGFVIENRLLGAALQHAAEGAVEIVAPARVIETEVQDERVLLRVEGGDYGQISTRLLVAADGARSQLREQMGIQAQVRHYGQTALIANVTPQRFHDHVAYERFTDNGPLALLPLSNGRCSLVWTVASEDADALLACDDEEFLARLQEQFGFRLGRLLRAGARAAWPLALVEAEQQTSVRSVLLGNAAHGLHPVAGQGFNLALRDVAALAEVIAAGAADPGSAEVLTAYAQWRQHDQRQVIDMTDSLVRLFSNPLLPVRAARSLGLLGLDLLPAAKRDLARRSMGMSGRLPRLARGLKLR